jgi:hypothetical protein
MKNNQTLPQRWSEFEKFLRPAHLAGRSTTVKIERIEMQETWPRPGKSEIAPVCYFSGKSKALILSNSNRRALGEIFGDSISDAIGKTVRLVIVDVRVGQESKAAIRIRKAVAASAAASNSGVAA